MAVRVLGVLGGVLAVFLTNEHFERQAYNRCEEIACQDQSAKAVTTISSE